MAKYISQRQRVLNVGIVSYTEDITSFSVVGKVGVGTFNASTDLDVDGGLRLRGALYDKDNNTGSIGQILVSTESGIDWQSIDGIQSIQKSDLVTPSNYAVLQDEVWTGLLVGYTEGMMFIDENNQLSSISKTKLESANCRTLDKNTTMLNNSLYFWHDENSLCTVKSLDYSLILMSSIDISGVSANSSGASIFQSSVIKFDVWPYSVDYSYLEQNELLYFIK